MTSAADFLDNERLQFDRFCRFLVCATEREGSRFIKFGLLGRLQRIGRQAGRTKEEVEDELWRRYQSYLGLKQRDPGAFWETTDRLIAAYGEEALRRWHVLKG
ncbi:hypothetical protein Q9314_13370 [Shinella sumterensis]|nr:hypothetical protein Q9314_13370 [Shinella sumterensis]